jgi:erythromycin esterase
MPAYKRERVVEATQLLREVAQPLAGLADLDPLLERIGDARYVLLGEATHGTSEFYRWRAQLSKRLIEKKGFSFIAVEGDWPDCFDVNQYVKQLRQEGTDAHSVLNTFDRWPTWMWANWEMAAFVEWLYNHNKKLSDGKKAGFYGLDVYSLWESLEAIMTYLKDRDPALLPSALKAYQCFEPYSRNVQEYARATFFVPESCQDEVVELLAKMRQAALPKTGKAREDQFNAEQNALVAKNAEQYYRTMILGSSASWNIRDRHMTETLERLMNFYGKDAKGIVWEHNTHIGDARATDMVQEGTVNVGQIVREIHLEKDHEVVLVGFGTYEGSVIAAEAWEAPMQRMVVPAAERGSWEDILHKLDRGDSLFIWPKDIPADDFLYEPRGHRAIGVVYHPSAEYGNYVPTVLPQRYDAFIYLDKTQALHPLHLEPHYGKEPPETYPWGV